MPTLKKANSLLLEQFGFVFGLDPFRDGFQSEPLCKIDQGADEQQILFIVDQVADE